MRNNTAQIKQGYLAMPLLSCNVFENIEGIRCVAITIDKHCVKVICLCYG